MKRLRNTRQRQTVLDFVFSLRDHPTADRLYLEIRALDPKISRGTVYRNLKILSELGEIQHMNLSGVEHFDWRLEPHAHLVCTKCGALCDAPLPYDAALDRLLEKKTGYESLRHQAIFSGLCPDCVREP